MINKKYLNEINTLWVFVCSTYLFVYTAHCFYSSQVSECNQQTKPTFFYISQKGLNGLKPVNDEGA